MKKGLFALIVGFAGFTASYAFTDGKTEDVSDSISYTAPYSLKVNKNAMEVTFASANTDQLSMVLSDQTGNVIFSKENVTIDPMSTVVIPLGDTSKPLRLDVKCASFTGKTFFPGSDIQQK